uniref:C2H2-type domain-containing protein n=1 Tax=viral metagenome TaxID=1070528 RepID=A0A6C0JYE1_9ZZZZ
MDDNIKSKEVKLFHCEICDFTSSKISNYKAHLLSSKHKKNDKMMTVDDKKTAKEADSIFACECGKEYKHRQGLWKHKKICIDPFDSNKIISENMPTDEPTLKEMFLKVVEQNQAILLENQEMRKLLSETIPKIGNTTNNTTNNNQFNLQFFLNETCKDALNLTDFVEQIKLQLSDLDMIGRVGYVEGITKIFLRNLKDIDVCKRPIHCSDLKRETLYIKDKDAWEKENGENIKIKRAIKGIEHKNIKQLPQWREENPTAEDTETKKHLEYQNILLEAMGGATSEDDNKKHEKIIRNIAKEVVIEKKQEK